jgi:hypothetical protein
MRRTGLPFSQPWRHGGEKNGPLSVCQNCAKECCLALSNAVKNRRTKRGLKLNQGACNILKNEGHMAWREGMGVESIRDLRQAPYWI